MTAQKKESPEETRIRQEWGHALERLSEDDGRLLGLIRLMGEVLDPRYEMKGIHLAIGRCLADPDFRSHLLADADAALSDLRGHVELPENTSIRCVENTADQLTIVLPPPSAALSERARSVRDSIFSRTSPDNDVTLAASGVDDNDILPFHFDADDGSGGHPADHSHWGDASRDG